MTGTTEPPTETITPKTEREVELEDRVRKLETALAERPLPAANEDAVADRVIAKLSALAGGPRSGSAADRVLVLDATTAEPFTVPPPPQGAVLHPPARSEVSQGQSRWFLAQLWAETRVIIRMYFDPYYRVSRTTQFAIPGIALFLVLNYFFCSVWVPIPFLSPILERLLILLAGILGYKLMVREIARYRNVLEYLARYGPR
jgi:hypothetical protein